MGITKRIGGVKVGFSSIKRRQLFGGREAAAWALKNGYQPVPIPAGLKGPRSTNWQKSTLKPSDVTTAFPAGSNIGLKTGDASKGLVDVDLDHPLAVRLAARLLPTTRMRHGRPTNPLSHYWYRVANWKPGARLASAKLLHPVSRQTLVEFRGDNLQTLIPPSFNDEIEENKKKQPGERLAWAKPFGPPSVHPLETLRKAVRRVAAATTLCSYWKPSTRHDAGMAIAGWLLRGGLPEKEVSDLLGAMAFAVGANERKVRATVHDTSAKLAKGQPTTGSQTLLKTFHYPAEVLAVVERWLDMSSPSSGTAGGSSGWPAPLSRDAFPGLIGRVIDAIAPHTEADRAALLGHLLVMVGNAIGRGPHVYAEGAEHHANLFAVFVGDSSKARKGTAAAQVRRFMKEVDPEWALKSHANGLSSGEGLIWRVRDQIVKSEPIKTKGKVTGYDDVVVDPGVSDKRLMDMESEFAQVLRVMRRESNTLSTMIRSAWDTGTLNVLTKNSPATATDAHISIIGHITKEELDRSLSDVDIFNGFANRFLWVCARRDKFLPHGGTLDRTVIVPLVHEMAESISLARGVKQILKSNKARAYWEHLYRRLGIPHRGLTGVATSRAEPIVLRLAMIYALVDRSKFIALPHLRAAAEVWRYCFDSAKYIFGGVVRNTVAHRVLEAVRSSPTGLTRTEINALFGGHRSSAEIDAAIKELQQTRFVRIQKVTTAGRAEVRVVLS